MVVNIASKSKRDSLVDKNTLSLIVTNKNLFHIVHLGKF